MMTSRLVKVTLVVAAVGGLWLGNQQQAMAGGYWLFKSSHDGGPEIWEYKHGDSDYTYLTDSAPAKPHPRNVAYFVTLHNPTRLTIDYSLNDEDEPQLKPGKSAVFIIMGSKDNPALFKIAFDRGQKTQVKYDLKSNASEEFQEKGGGIDLAANERLVWSYKGGFFADKDKGNWIEETPSGTYKFRAVSRNTDYIELYDMSRDCTVRLSKDAMLLKGLDGFKDFTKRCDGKWTK